MTRCVSVLKGCVQLRNGQCAPRFIEAIKRSIRVVEPTPRRTLLADVSTTAFVGVADYLATSREHEATISETLVREDATVPLVRRT